MQLSAYDLEQTLAKRFTVSMESEQEIEIQAEEVIINSDASVDGEIEELAEDVSVVEETNDNIDDVEEATETLESLIATMESRLLTGGFDKTNAQLANISLESITHRFGLESTILSFGMEAVEDDAESETKSTIGKAKQMLGALKSNAGALLNKMYMAAASALGNNAALSAKLIAKAESLKGNINSDNKGGNPVKLARGVQRKLTLDGKTALAPDAYLKELQRLTSKYNTVVKSYADSDMLGSFVTDIISGTSGNAAEPRSKKAIIASVKSIGDGISKASKSPEGIDAAESAPYLGGAVITMRRPSVKAIEASLTAAVTEQVSQEGIKTQLVSTAKFHGGSLLYVLGFGGSVIGPAAIVGGAALGVMAAPAAGIGLSLWGAQVAILSAAGRKKGGELVMSGLKENTDDFINMAKGAKNKIFGAAKEASEVATEFELESNGVSMEADENATATSLSASQIAQVADLIQATSATTQTMRAQLNKRKAIMKSVDQLTKALSTENKEGSSQLTVASGTFIKQFIKQTIKFEMDLTSYSVSVMKAALAYAEASNGSKAAEEPEAAAE